MGSKNGYKMYSLSTTVREIERVPDLLKTIVRLETASINKIKGSDGISDKATKEKYVAEIIKDGFVISGKVDESIINKIQIGETLSDEDAKTFMVQAEQSPGWAARLSNYLNKIEPLGLAHRKERKEIVITELGKYFLDNPIEALNWSLTNIPVNNPFKRNLNSFTVSGVLASYFKKMNRKRISDFDLAVLVSLHDINDISKFDFRYNDYSTANELSPNISKETIKDYVDELKRTLVFAKIANRTFKGIELSDMFLSNVDNIISDSHNSIKVFKDIETQQQMMDYINSLDWNLELKLDESESNIEKIKRVSKDFTYEQLIELIDSIKRNETIDVPNLNPEVMRYVVIEWLFALLLAKDDENIVDPRLSLDPNGFPISQAGPGKTDILVINNEIRNGYEITLMTSRTQMINNETTNLIRHIKDDEATSLMFLAPSIHEDVKEFFDFADNKYKDISVNYSTFDDFLEEYRKPGSKIINN